MNRNAEAIIALCSRLCADGVTPLTPGKWSAFLRRLTNAGKTPADLFSFSRDDFEKTLFLTDEETDRLLRLLDRAPALSAALARYRSMGIETVTPDDADAYPPLLRKKLGSTAPPVFYIAGDRVLLARRCIGYVGSRKASEDDLTFTESAVRKTVQRGFGVVSGGANGVDTAAEKEAIRSGSFAVEYLSDSMVKKLGKRDTAHPVQSGSLVLISSEVPDAGFSTGIAMMRNRYIYAHSEATVVVRSDLGKGGTWTGASNALRYGWCTTLCRDHPYPGNAELIKRGALPITEDWDGSVPVREENRDEFEQTSLFAP